MQMAEEIKKKESEAEAPGDIPEEDSVKEADASEAASTQEEKTPEERLSEEVEALKKELAEEKEKYLRLDAEYYNYRTRSVREKQEAYTNAVSDTVVQLLSVIDNFERAAAAECSDTNYKKGVEMIFRQYTDILAKLEVREIEALGQPFDPQYHNAVGQTEDESLGENTVAAVLQKGYMLGKKVIRPAMVTVANP